MTSDTDTHKEFRRRLKDEWKQKTVCDRFYVLTTELKEWMKKETRGSATNCAKLLQAEYQNHTRSFHQPLQASQVCSDNECCCLVFSILLDIGRGNILDIFHSAKIFDHHLPSADYYYPDLKERLAEANFSQTDINKIITDFDYSKRSYCLAELKPRSDSFHHGKWILPICRKRRINNKGGTAAIWEILVKSEVLPKELKDKVPHAATNDEEFGWCYHFALKEYSFENEDSYKWEKQAFQLFVGQDGMIQYLGDFTYDEKDSQSRTFNILLEFGELDLDEHFAEVRPPRLSLEIHQFWSDLFEVAKALKKFHNVELKYDDGRDQHISGWHADVKPDNILSVRGSFVLADFGFARFQKKSTKLHDEPAFETLTGGTDTYGAPETDAIRRGEAALTSVMQTIDIWSFGCVLSMAATWVVFGFQGIRDYEAVRRKATAALRENNEPGPVANDAFHNGKCILPEVLIWHAYLRENLRKSDVTTEFVLALIEEHMLLEDPAARFDSALLCSKLAEIVEQSMKESSGMTNPMTANFINLLVDIDAYATDLDITSQNLASHDAVKLAPRASLLVPSGSSRLPPRAGSPSDRQVKKSQRINAIPRLKTTVRNTRRLGIPSQKTDLGHMEEFKVPWEKVQPRSTSPSPVSSSWGDDAQVQTEVGDRRRAQPEADPAHQQEQYTAFKPTARPTSMVRNPTLLVTEVSDSHLIPNDSDEVETPNLRVDSKSPSATYEPNATDGSEFYGTLPTGPSSDGSRDRGGMDKGKSPRSRSAAYGHHHDSNAPFPSTAGHGQTDANGHPSIDLVRPSPSPLQPSESYREEAPMPTPVVGGAKDLFHLPSKQTSNEKAPLDSSESSTLFNVSSTTISQYTDETRLDPTLSGNNHALREKISTDHISLRSHGRSMSAQSALPNHGPYNYHPPNAKNLDIVQVRHELNAKIEKTSHKLLDKLGLAKADPLLTNYIQNRDIAFIVDNGTTMAHHWSDVSFTLETLYLKLDGLDKNGVDLVFTDRAKSNHNREELKRSWGRTALVRSMNEAQPATPNEFDERVRTNMREVLSPIFQKFLTSRQDKRMTLIVLTDGMWEGSNNEEGVADKIADFYKSWHDKWRVVEDRWFSIQFVSFGKDDTALRRLQVLDDELGAKYEIPDFVDTEPWTGSVMKMITGSLSDELDAGGGERSPPPKTPKTPTFPNADLSRNGTTKGTSRFSMFTSRKAQAGPSYS